MEPDNNKEVMEKIAGVLDRIRQNGARLWAANGRLHYRAAKGAIAEADIETIRQCKSQIVALLENATDAVFREPTARSGSGYGPVPLAFSQLAHWHQYKLYERPAIRQIASAVRLRGHFDINAFRVSLNEILRRHEALRTRIVVCDGVPMQEISSPEEQDVALDDLTALDSDKQETATHAYIEALILSPINVSGDPLWGLKLLKIGDTEHILIVAMEHMISDMFSLNVLLRDLFTAYTQASQGREISLPTIPLQFHQYSDWERSTASAWIKRHKPYWEMHLNGGRRVRFPDDPDFSADNSSGWGVVPLEIEKRLETELSRWSRQGHTTLAMSAFTAYVVLVSRWCGVSDMVVQFVVDGRGSSKIENTIGNFAMQMPLRVCVRESDNFMTLLRRITTEYCEAYAHLDHSYMEAQVPRPEFTSNTCFNWVPHGSGMAALSEQGQKDLISWSEIQFVNPMLRTLERDAEPCVILFHADAGIAGGVYFPRSRFSDRTMRAFARSFLCIIETMLRDPTATVGDTPVVRSVP